MILISGKKYVHSQPEKINVRKFYKIKRFTRKASMRFNIYQKKIKRYANNISYTHVYLEVERSLNSTQKLIPMSFGCTWRKHFATVGGDSSHTKSKISTWSNLYRLWKGGTSYLTKRQTQKKTKCAQKTKTKKVKSRAKPTYGVDSSQN